MHGEDLGRSPREHASLDRPPTPDVRRALEQFAAIARGDARCRACGEPATHVTGVGEPTCDEHAGLSPTALRIRRAEAIAAEDRRRTAAAIEREDARW